MFFLLSLLLSYCVVVHGNPSAVIDCMFSPAECPQVDPNSNCSIPVCRIPAGVCGFDPCEPVGFCKQAEGVCVPKCTNSSQCPLSGAGPCRMPDCLPSGLCVFKNCKADHLFCSDPGICANCSVDSECDFGEICNQGLCLPPICGGPSNVTCPNMGNCTFSLCNNSQCFYHPCQTYNAALQCQPRINGCPPCNTPANNISCVDANAPCSIGNCTVEGYCGFLGCAAFNLSCDNVTGCFNASIPPTGAPTVFTPTSIPATPVPTNVPTGITKPPPAPPTNAPTIFVFPTNAPTNTPTQFPTSGPTPFILPTPAPSVAPTSAPTTIAPTALPTGAPTIFVFPTNAPTNSPTQFPTSGPTPFILPTPAPSVAPTSAPTTAPPTQFPTGAPTAFPPTPLVEETGPPDQPTNQPTTTASPTKAPTAAPSPFGGTLSPAPTKTSTAKPTPRPTRRTREPTPNGGGEDSSGSAWIPIVYIIVIILFICIVFAIAKWWRQKKCAKPSSRLVV